MMKRIVGLLALMTACMFQLCAQDSSFILTTQSLTPYFPTFIGSGKLSLSSSQLGTKGTESYMAWVYDQGKGDIPRIAAVPAWNEINISNGSRWLNDAVAESTTIRSFRQTLNMYDGTLSTSYDWVDEGKRTHIQVESFVSRSSPNLGVIRCTITPGFSGKMEVELPLKQWDEPRRIALDEVDSIHVKLVNGWPDVWYPGHTSLTGTGQRISDSSISEWVTGETDGRGTKLAEAALIKWSREIREPAFDTTRSGRTVSSVRFSFSATGGTSYSIYKYVAVSSSYDTSRQLEHASSVINNIESRTYEEIRRHHTEAWHRVWDTDIIVDGSPEMQRLIHSMLFYIFGSIREETGFSLPPMGLSSSGYYGHIFWDADTWMFPSLLLMHPEMARSIVMFRNRTLHAAMANAQKNKYRGAMYPWESDEIGAETTPKFAYQNALHENHVTGDVALAQWQYYLATGDKEWLKAYGYPVISATADFWTSKATYNRAKDRYDINDIVSVDEGLIGIKNDTYTNAVAEKNLEIAMQAAKLLDEKGNPDWQKVKEKIFIPYNRQEEFHPTYEGAPDSALGSVVTLLSYPLDLTMSKRAEKNNFENAVKRMKEQGAGVMMTITFAPIVAVELQDSSNLNYLVRNAYRGYLRPPFNVLAETEENNSINFLTGAGGYLQQIIYGYTGLRLNEEGATEKFKPLLPSDIKKLTLRNFTIRGKRYDIIVENNNLRFVNR